MPTATPTPPPSTDVNMKVAGTMFLATSKKYLAPEGTLTGRFDSPHFTGSLTLKPMTVDLTVLGFIPAQINLGFSAAGAASGTYAGGTFTLNAPMNFTVSSMTIFGFPFGGGSGCRTESPVQLSISAPNSNVFDPANLAYLQGGFTIASMNNQCGFLGGIVSGQLAGPGNTLGLLLQTV